MSIEFDKLQADISNYMIKLDEKELELFEADLGNFYDEHGDVQHQILILLKLESLELKKFKSSTFTLQDMEDFSNYVCDWANFDAAELLEEWQQERSKPTVGARQC